MNIFNILAGFASGIIGAMGLGGGGILVLYLTLVLNMEQLNAQGINLLFFIPCAIISLVIHIKNKLIDFKKIIPLVIGGIIGTSIGYLLTTIISTKIISKIFAIFLIILGTFELLKRKTNPQ